MDKQERYSTLRVERAPAVMQKATRYKARMVGDVKFVAYPGWRFEYRDGIAYHMPPEMG